MMFDGGSFLSGFLIASSVLGYMIGKPLIEAKRLNIQLELNLDKSSNYLWIEEANRKHQQYDELLRENQDLSKRVQLLEISTKFGDNFIDNWDYKKSMASQTEKYRAVKAAIEDTLDADEPCEEQLEESGGWFPNEPEEWEPLEDINQWWDKQDEIIREVIPEDPEPDGKPDHRNLTYGKKEILKTNKEGKLVSKNGKGAKENAEYAYNAWLRGDSWDIIREALGGVSQSYAERKRNEGRSASRKLIGGKTMVKVTDGRKTVEVPECGISEGKWIFDNRFSSLEQSSAM